MKIHRPIRLFALALLGLIAVALGGAYAQLAAQKSGSSTSQETGKTTAPATAAAVSKPAAGKGDSLPMVPDPKQVGGEPEGIVQVANLVYAGVKSSHCFADHFLVTAEKESSISNSRRF